MHDPTKTVVPPHELTTLTFCSRNLESSPKSTERKCCVKVRLELYFERFPTPSKCSRVEFSLCGCFQRESSCFGTNQSLKLFRRPLGTQTGFGGPHRAQSDHAVPSEVLGEASIARYGRISILRSSEQPKSVLRDKI